jgi:hypothetical protein
MYVSAGETDIGNYFDGLNQRLNVKSLCTRQIGISIQTCQKRIRRFFEGAAICNMQYAICNMQYAICIERLVSDFDKLKLKHELEISTKM